MINIKKSLYGIVLAVFIFQVVKFYSFYLEYSVWQYADWVINYQAGFVRRGLIGEILFRIYQLTSIDLDFLILAFVILIIMFSSYFLMRSIKYVAASYINLLIFFSKKTKKPITNIIKISFRPMICEFIIEYKKKPGEKKINKLI